jgi:hypothetical protein
MAPRDERFLAICGEELALHPNVDVVLYRALLGTLLPTLVVVDENSEHASILAYANGARFCLSEPVSPVDLANAIADLQPAAER